MSTSFGIDLGTTNSVIAHILDGKPVAIPIDGHVIVPSVVLYDGARVVVGREAANLEAEHPEHTIRSTKRKMGQPFQYSIAGRQVAPEEVSAEILRALKRGAESALGHPVMRRRPSPRPTSRASPSAASAWWAGLEPEAVELLNLAQRILPGAVGLGERTISSEHLLASLVELEVDGLAPELGGEIFVLVLALLPTASHEGDRPFATERTDRCTQTDFQLLGTQQCTFHVFSTSRGCREILPGT